MTEETALDRAHGAMEAAPGDDTARLAFYGCLAEGELFLLLEQEATGETIEPRLFPLEDGPFVLAFDTEARLAEFAAGPAPYGAMPGRQMARLLAGQGIGLALNLGSAPSQMLLPAEAVTWLADIVATGPQPLSARIEAIAPPGDLPDLLLNALDSRLARAEGLAHFAYLSRVTYGEGRQGHLLAFVDALPGAEDTLAQAVNEALTFSGLAAGEIDVAFLAATDPMAARLARWGLRIDLPKPERAPDLPPTAPPDRPPRLR